MPARLSLLFSVTTQAANASLAVPHSGGWSESHWANTLSGITQQSIQDLAAARARALSSLASITGYRIQDFTIAGNKLLPNSSSSGRILLPGGSTAGLNMPQDGLSIYMATGGAPNVSRQVLRGMPDDYVVNGEYTPVPGFNQRVLNYIALLVSANWKFVGRDRSVPNARVLAIAGGVVTLAGPVGGLANNSFLRLNRVIDVNGNPVIGTFLITAIAGNLYSVSGLGATSVVRPSGTARIDQIAVFPYSSGRTGRTVVRKIGRPFEQYRGRASKRAVR
jgi:hypothetical protein